MAKSNIFPLALGLIVGVMLSYIFTQYDAISKRTSSMKRQPIFYGNRDYSLGGNSFYLQRRSLNNMTSTPTIDNEMTRMVKSFPFDPNFNSSLLRENIKILCYVMCARGSKPAMIAVKAVTEKHCHKVVLFTKGTEKDIGTVDLGFELVESQSWERYKKATEYVYNQFRLDYDLFIKLEYDIFVVPENVCFMSLLHQAYIPGYLGHVLTDDKDRGVVTILTREGLSILHEAIPSCPAQKGGKKEDVELVECLQPLHVYHTKESKDAEGKPRFQMLIPDHELPGNTIKYNPWYMRYIHHPSVEGPECCSDFSISFHYVAPNIMYQLEYMIYHMRPFGVGYYSCPAEIRSIVGLPEVTGSESSAGKAETVVADEKREDDKKETGAEVEDKDEKKKTEGEAAIDLTKQKQAEEKEEKQTGEEEETPKGGGKENAAQSGE